MTRTKTMERPKRQRDTEPLTAQDRIFEIRYQQEMDKLTKLTEMLKNQQELHNYEKRLILQERERVLKEKEDSSREIETIKN